MLRLICMFLGCDLPIQLQLKSLSSVFDDRLVDRFHHAQSQTMKFVAIPQLLIYMFSKKHSGKAGQLTLANGGNEHVKL